MTESGYYCAVTFKYFQASNDPISAADYHPPPPPTLTVSINARRSSKDNPINQLSTLKTKLVLKSLAINYSQTCTQQPLSGLKKWPLLTGGRCSEVI